MTNDDEEVKKVDPAPTPPQQAAVTLKLPTFWPADPELWILQVEAQFRTRNITQDSTKYDYIVGSLSPETAGEIRDVLLHPPENDKYTAIKAALLKRNELSEQKRLQELLSKEELGDRRPTQVLRRMRQLVGDTVMDPKVLRALFIQKLPLSVQQIMVTAADEVALEAMADMAEKIMEVTTAQVNKVQVADQAAASSSEISQLRQEVQQLKQMISGMSIQGQSAANQRNSSRGRSPYRRQRDVNRYPLCWYHHRFGEKSTKCDSPCSWSSKNGGHSPSK